VFITSTKEVKFLSGICLFVCLLATSCKNSYLQENLPEMFLFDLEELVKYWKSSHLDATIEFF